jgi:hypothetical protein
MLLSKGVRVGPFIDSAATDQHESRRSTGRRRRPPRRERGGEAFPLQASKGAVTDGFFFARRKAQPVASKPGGAPARKIRSGHKPLQCRRAQPADDQSGGRRRRRLGEGEERLPPTVGRSAIRTVSSRRPVAEPAGIASVGTSRAGTLRPVALAPAALRDGFRREPIAAAWKQITAAKSAGRIGHPIATGVDVDELHGPWCGRSTRCLLVSME